MSRQHAFSSATPLDRARAIEIIAKRSELDVDRQQSPGLDALGPTRLTPASGLFMRPDRFGLAFSGRASATGLRGLPRRWTPLDTSAMLFESKPPFETGAARSGQ